MSAGAWRRRHVRRIPAEAAFLIELADRLAPREIEPPNASRYGPGARTGEGRRLCPVRVCTWPVPSDKLMCPGHWRMVPGPLRKAIWAAWQGGAGAGTPAHLAAIRAAIRSVNSHSRTGQ